MSNVEIQEAAFPDASFMADLWLKANTARRHGRLEVRADARALIEERMRSPGSLFVLAKIAGRIVGIASQLPARESDGTGPIIPGLVHLSMIAVDPAHWGKGVGKALTEYCVRRAAKLGYTSIQLWTQISNERARRLYSSVGFVEGGREKTDDRGEQIRLYVLCLNT
jgi:ribosomal protein S18 acetylase RimI-like enzyme